MGEELLQRNLLRNPPKIGKWDFYNIGSTTVRTLKENNIIRNVDYGQVEGKKVDGIIVTRKNVIAIVENKRPSDFNTRKKQDKAVSQELDVAQKLNCKILIATDMKETVWVNALTGNRIKDVDGKDISQLFDPDDEGLPAFIEKILSSINELNDSLKPKELVNPTDLAKQIWQDIWSVTGATPENCLYTFVELFIFKYLSDLGVLKGIHSFAQLHGSYGENNQEEMLEHYATTIRPKIKELFPENIDDKTTIINGTIFVSKDQKAVKGYSSVFKKVLDKFNNYGKLEHIDFDFKSQLFESFLKESISKKNWGQFFTPLKVVRAIIEMAKEEIREGAHICDPACGVGKFLLEPIATKLDQFYRVVGNKIEQNIFIHGFDKGFDRDEQKTIILAKANMLIYFSDLIKDNPGLTKEFSSLFNSTFSLKTNSILGSLADVKENCYDLILTNPPYVTSGSSNLKEEVKKDGELTNFYKVNALGVEGLFMEWIVRSLKPNGKAFVVIPDGMLNRRYDRQIRNFILEECFVDGLISLPLNTFFTTNKKTYILCLTKKPHKQQVQSAGVFTYFVSEIGESRDVYRFDIEQNDLKDAVTLYSFFKANKAEFARINSEKRCKIVPYSFFKDNLDEGWIIDKLWTETERIEIGIIEENKSIDLFEFSSLLDAIATSLRDYQEETKELAEKKNTDRRMKRMKVSELFRIERGKGIYTKRYINANRGSYPVFSGNTSGPFAHIGSFDYDVPCLSWSIDGLAGFVMFHDERFSATNHRGVLIPTVSGLDLRYAKSQLEPLFRSSKKGRLGQDGSNEYTALPPFMIRDLEIEIPIDQHGRFDETAQEELVHKVQFLQDVVEETIQFEKLVRTSSVQLDIRDMFAFPFTDFAVNELFSIERGHSRYTKKYGNTHKGPYPVFSASNREPLTHIDSYDFDGKFLTWATNGFAGFMRIVEGRFSINADRALLRTKCDRLDLNYVRHMLEPLFRSASKGRKGERGEDEFTKLYPSMVEKLVISIPTDKNGEPDLDAQNQVAAAYQKVDEMKSLVAEELIAVRTATVKIS